MEKNSGLDRQHSSQTSARERILEFRQAVG
jgi:hypothetical protein